MISNIYTYRQHHRLRNVRYSQMSAEEEEKKHYKSKINKNKTNEMRKNWQRMRITHWSGAGGKEIAQHSSNVKSFVDGNMESKIKNKIPIEMAGEKRALTSVAQRKYLGFSFFFCVAPFCSIIRILLLYELHTLEMRTNYVNCSVK